MSRPNCHRRTDSLPCLWLSLSGSGSGSGPGRMCFHSGSKVETPSSECALQASRGFLSFPPLASSNPPPARGSPSFFAPFSARPPALSLLLASSSVRCSGLLFPSSRLVRDHQPPPCPVEKQGPTLLQLCLQSSRSQKDPEIEAAILYVRRMPRPTPLARAAHVVE